MTARDTGNSPLSEQVPSGPYFVAAGGFWTKEGIESLLVERDRYRAALERIYRQGRGPHAVALAREALDV